MKTTNLTIVALALSLGGCAAQHGRSQEASPLGLLAEQSAEAGDFTQAAIYAVRALERAPRDRAALGALRRAISENQLIAAGSVGAPARSVGFTGDGRSVLVRDSLGGLSLMDAETGAIVRRFGDSATAVNAARLSADGARVLAALLSGDVVIWETSSGNRLLTISGVGDSRRRPVWYARFDPSGERIVTATANGEMVVWDAATGARIAQLDNQETVIAPRFSRDGSRVLAMPAGWNGAAIWDAQTGRLLLKFGERREGLFFGSEAPFAQFSPDETRVLTVMGPTAQLWNATTGERIAELGEFTDGILDASFSPDGAWIGLASADWTAMLVRTDGPGYIRLRGHEGPVNWIDFSPDGARVLTASADGSARLYEVDEWAVLVDQLNAGRTSLWSAFSADGERVATANDEGDVAVWRVERGNTQQVPAGTPIVQNTIFNADGSRMFTQVFGAGQLAARGLNQDGNILWDTENDALVAPIEPPPNLQDVFFTPDGQHLILAGQNAIHIIDAAIGVATNRIVHAIPDNVRDVSPDASRIITTSVDGGISVWDVRTGVLLSSYRTEGENILGAEFADGGARLLTRHFPIAGGSSARLWDPVTGALIVDLKRDRYDVTSASVTPDGSRIITTSNGRTGGIWDAHTGALLAPFVGETSSHSRRGYVTDPNDFSADGEKFLAMGPDGRLRVWDTHTGASLVRINTIWGHDAHFSRDGGRVVTIEIRRARLWDAASGQEIGSQFFSGAGALPFHSLEDAFFGRTHVFAVGLGYVFPWDISFSREGADRLIERACATMPVFRRRAGETCAPTNPSGRAALPDSSRQRR